MKTFFAPSSPSQGPGVGKGRQVAALILENFLQGRTKVSDALS